MNELQFAREITRRLNHGLRELPAETASRLAAARQQALVCQKQLVHQSALATVGNWLLPDTLHFPQILIPFILLMSLTVCSTFWFADRQIDEQSAIDSALLADELPIGAFTDQGFNTWLKRSSSE